MNLEQGPALFCLITTLDQVHSGHFSLTILSKVKRLTDKSGGLYLRNIRHSLMLGIGVVLNLADNGIDFHSLLLEVRRYPGSRGGTERLYRCALTAVLVAVSSQGSQTEESQAKQAYLHMGRGMLGNPLCSKAGLQHENPKLKDRGEGI